VPFHGTHNRVSISIDRYFYACEGFEGDQRRNAIDVTSVGKFTPAEIR
jgi:hypothetical protein